MKRAYVDTGPLSLAADLARYGTSAQWKGVYYRGEKIGFMVGQTVPTDDGFELQEEGRLQMALLGATSEARIRTSARVDRQFNLRSFAFSLDPGTGPIEVRGTLRGGSSRWRSSPPAVAAPRRVSCRRHRPSPSTCPAAWPPRGWPPAGTTR